MAIVVDNLRKYDLIMVSGCYVVMIIVLYCMTKVTCGMHSGAGYASNT